MANKKNIKYSFNECNWFELADLLLANSDELNLNLKCLLAFLPSSGFLTLCMATNIFRRKWSIIFVF